MKSRRAFLEEVSLASLLAGFPAFAQEPLSRLADGPRPTVRPKALKKGSTIALISPSSPNAEAESNVIAAEVVRSLGFVPKPMPSLGKSTMYLAGTDAERAADLNAAFADPGVDGIWCLRGGYGSSRILPLVNYELVLRNPKVFIGYSDITALLNALHRVTGLVTFHGPNAGDNETDYTLDGLQRVVQRAEPAGVVAAAPPLLPRPGWVDREDRLRRIAKGRCRGPLVGGNISVLDTLIGTPFEPELKGRILFLEEVGEEPYRIDRWLTHLVLTGKLSGCAGIVLGKFRDCGPSEKGSFQGTWTWQEVAADRLGKLGVPVLAGLRFGHIADKATLPLGVNAELDVEAGTLTLLEPAVV